MFIKLHRLNITPEANLVKLIIRAMLDGKKEGIKDLLGRYSINWESFKELIIYHDLVPFAYSASKDLNLFLPQNLMEFLMNNYYCAMVRCEQLWQEFLRILTAFEKTGVLLLPIKGVALLKDIYKGKSIRPMTDIDLLVKEEDLPKAEAVFYDLGYRKELFGLKQEYWRKRQCHITFYRKEDERLPFVELHWAIDFKRRNRTVLPQLWTRIREINADGRRIKLLSPEDTLFSLALHNRRLGRTLCLKNIYDAVLLLNKYAVDFDWNYCLDVSRKYNICSTLFFALYQIKFLSVVDIPEYVWKGLNIPAWKKGITQRFIEENTFLVEKNRNVKDLYLKSHFLLYDSLWEPVDYILNIPKEQFAKFYGLKPYDSKTNLFYRNRLLYIPSKVLMDKIINASKN